MTQHIYSSLPATHRQIVFYPSVRSLSHRPPELPANLLLLPSPYLPALFSVQPELPTSTPDLHSLQTCLSLEQ
ncbi:hypothetical protein F7725_010981 [Dissostichus mawsoni]|uniref:Uncharacterized protein n=1 Tax=Dissostichus mawsoni TaxID=36200 RepID=A0A7J5Z841_DISMA|nr:hypothetical protein F7725_010981 [Dissostichus mawsoni]